jgi:hypothetical protein
MTKLRTSVSGDNALRAFYEACGVSPVIIERTIKARYQEPTQGVGKTRIAGKLLAKRLGRIQRRGERAK